MFYSRGQSPFRPHKYNYFFDENLSEQNFLLTKLPNRTRTPKNRIFGQEKLEKNNAIYAKKDEKFEFTIVYSPSIS